MAAQARSLRKTWAKYKPRGAISASRKTHRKIEQMKKMSFFNQIGTGLLAGFAISFVVAVIGFQIDIFRQGAESLGVSFFGFSYFFGGLVSSVILWALSKGRSSAKFLGLFGVAIIAVGSIGLGNVMADSGSSDPIDLQRNMEGMARLVAQLFFWGIPAVVVILYGVALVDAQHNKPE